MDYARFFVESKRRSVYRVAVAYVVVPRLLIQVATQTFPIFEIPNRTARAVILILCLGFPVALILAWACELTPRASSERTRRSVRSVRRRPGSRVWSSSARARSRSRSFLVGRQNGRNHDRGVVSPDGSIAVLPFESLSRDADNAYFAEGIQTRFSPDWRRSRI
jgi:hypothetical protein